MDVLITMKLRTTSDDLQQVTNAVYGVIEKLVTGANITKERKLKTNTILSFEAVQIKPNSLITKEFIFPNDLDQIKP
jgi:hypothetical protein